MVLSSIPQAEKPLSLVVGVGGAELPYGFSPPAVRVADCGG